MGATPGSQELLRAPLTIGYDFQRTTGPVIGAFLTALREQRVLAIRDTAGRAVCPPVEYDPQTGAPLTEMLEVGTEGTVTSWSWVANTRDGQPLSTPHALALIRLDGADTAMLHLIDAPGPEAVSTGARVRIRWADEPQGLIDDIACFELVSAGAGNSEADNGEGA
jgi:uncharacterized OB-fold protein